MDQIGKPMVVDKRVNFRTVRVMPGSKGSVRQAQVYNAPDEKEYLITVGCDRHVRVFDASEMVQTETQVAAAYLKQKLNCFLVSDKIN